MNRLTLGTLVSAACAAVVAFLVGGREGMGGFAGFLLGASLSGFGVAWQLHVFRTAPDRVFGATVSVLLFKLAVLLAGTLAFRYLEPVAEKADWRSFAVAYAAGVLVVMVLGLLDTLTLLKQRRSVA
ncbi:MAG: hypothetical protein AAF682_09685 [Planctomycetota bacterium]